MAKRGDNIKPKTKASTNKPLKVIEKKDKPAFEVDSISVNLTDQQQMFCQKYCCNGFNGTKAAIEVGYNEKTAASQASRLLSNVNILNYINELKADLGKRTGITAERIALEYSKIAFSNVKNIFNEGGELKDIKDISDEDAAAISSIEVEALTEGRLKTVIGTVTKIKFHNKVQALSDLNTMLGYNKPTKVAQTDSEGNDVGFTINSADQLREFLKGKK